MKSFTLSVEELQDVIEAKILRVEQAIARNREGSLNANDTAYHMMIGEVRGYKAVLEVIDGPPRKEKDVFHDTGTCTKQG